MRVVAAIACCVLAVIGPVGAQTAPGPLPVPPDPRLLIIGDSVSLGAQGFIHQRLGIRGWRVEQVSRENMRTSQAPSIIDAYKRVGGVGQVVILQLGTNDGGDAGAFASYIDGAMAHLTDVSRVFWVNLRQFRPWVPAANATLAAATARWPNLRVIDWDAIATPNPALVYADGYHLNPNGQLAMADLMGVAVDSYMVEVTTPSTTVPPTTLATTTTTEIETLSQDVTRKRPSEGIAISTVLAVFAGVIVVAGGLALVATRAGSRRRQPPLG